MWRILVVTVVMASLGEAQRPSYAPRPGSNSKLLPRYRQTGPSGGLGTRGGEEESSSSPAPEPSLSPDLEGTLEDKRFVQRVSQWPEERQPFWFKNRHAISSLRGREIDGGNRASGSSIPSPEFRSPFQGSANLTARSSSSARVQRPTNEFQSGSQVFDGRRSSSDSAFLPRLDRDGLLSRPDLDPYGLYLRLRSNS